MPKLAPAPTDLLAKAIRLWPRLQPNIDFPWLDDERTLYTTLPYASWQEAAKRDRALLGLAREAHRLGREPPLNLSIKESEDGTVTLALNELHEVMAKCNRQAPWGPGRTAQYGIHLQTSVDRAYALIPILVEAAAHWPKIMPVPSQGAPPDRASYVTGKTLDVLAAHSLETLAQMACLRGFGPGFTLHAQVASDGTATLAVGDAAAVI